MKESRSIKHKRVFTLQKKVSFFFPFARLAIENLSHKSLPLSLVFPEMDGFINSGKEKSYRSEQNKSKKRENERLNRRKEENPSPATLKEKKLLFPSSSLLLVKPS